MRDRIESILKDQAISSSKFADEIGIQRSSISHILSGRNKPSLDVFQRILRKYPNINSEWLILGIGDMYKNSASISVESKGLFDELEHSNVQKAENIEEKTTLKPTIPKQIVQQNTVNQQSSEQKSIEKIIIFYSDKSFEVYN